VDSDGTTRYRKGQIIDWTNKLASGIVNRAGQILPVQLTPDPASEPAWRGRAAHLLEPGGH
jgi:hypothetical protein